MNDQLQTALAEMINKSTTGIEKASGFLQAEIPDVVRQLLLWHGIQDFICFCTGLVLLAGWGYCLRRFVIKNWAVIKEKDDNEGFLITMLALICGVVLVIPFAFIFPLTWLKIWIAPKVWLLDYAASLVK